MVSIRLSRFDLDPLEEVKTYERNDCFVDQ